MRFIVIAVGFALSAVSHSNSRAEVGFKETSIGYVHQDYFDTINALAGSISIEEALECSFASQITSFFAEERSEIRRKSLGLASLADDPDFKLGSEAAVMQMSWIDVVHIRRINRSFGTQNNTSDLSNLIFSSDVSGADKSALANESYVRCLRLYEAAGGKL